MSSENDELGIDGPVVKSARDLLTVNVLDALDQFHSDLKWKGVKFGDCLYLSVLVLATIIGTNIAANIQEDKISLVLSMINEVMRKSASESVAIRLAEEKLISDKRREELFQATIDLLPPGPARDKLLKVVNRLGESSARDEKS